MNDSGEPRTRSGAAPPPAPPAAAVDGREVLFRHFLRNEHAYTREALERAAVETGYSPDDVAAAWARVQATYGEGVSASRYGTWARLLVLGLYAGTFLLFAAGSNLSERTYQVGTWIL